MPDSPRYLHRKQPRVMPFPEPWWLPGGHLQTVWRLLARRPEAAERKRQRIKLRDGDFLDLDWQFPATDRELLSWLPVTIIIHGLCGSSQSHYVLALQDQLARRGQVSVAVNLRGCSGEPNLLARAYHSGATEDLDVVLAAVQQAHPERQVCLVGYSLGANQLLKWLGEKPVPACVHKAVAVSSPFSLSACAQQMMTGLGRFYGQHFLRQLVADLRLKREHFEQAGNAAELRKIDDLGDLQKLRNIWQFDDQVTAPLHGFDGAEDYYTRCSSGQFLGSITTPTLLISSANDPIIPEPLVPEHGQLPDSVRLELWHAGGHVGFRSGTDANWLEKRILGFLDS